MFVVRATVRGGVCILSCGRSRFTFHEYLHSTVLYMSSASEVVLCFFCLFKATYMTIEYPGSLNLDRHELLVEAQSVQMIEVGIVCKRNFPCSAKIL